MRLANGKLLFGVTGRKGKYYMHEKLCRLASEKHRFGPKNGLRSNLIASKFQNFSGGGMPLDPPSCCVSMHTPLI